MADNTTTNPQLSHSNQQLSSPSEIINNKDQAQEAIEVIDKELIDKPYMKGIRKSKEVIAKKVNSNARALLNEVIEEVAPKKNKPHGNTGQSRKVKREDDKRLSANRLESELIEPEIVQEKASELTSELLRKEITDIKKLPRPVKIATAKTLQEKSYSIRRIAEIMGIDRATVANYLTEAEKAENDPTSPLSHYSSAIKNIYKEQDFELAQLAYQQIKEKLPRARFFELVGLMKTVRDFDNPAKGSSTGVQANNAIVFQIIKDSKEGDNSA